MLFASATDNLVSLEIFVLLEFLEFVGLSYSSSFYLEISSIYLMLFLVSLFVKNTVGLPDWFGVLDLVNGLDIGMLNSRVYSLSYFRLGLYYLTVQFYSNGSYCWKSIFINCRASLYFTLKSVKLA